MRERRSASSGTDLINNFCKFLINKESSNEPEKQEEYLCRTPDTSGQTKSRRLSKLFTGEVTLNSPLAKASPPKSASTTLKDDFTNFSTESAKELMARMEAEANHLGASSGGKAAKVDQSEKAERTKEASTCPTAPTTPRAIGPIFDGIVAFVDVRSQHENRSRCVEEQLSLLGAKVSPKLVPSVTHMVFKDGGLSSYNKAKKLGVFIVSVSWIEACKKAGERVPEAQFPTVSKEKYDSPNLFPKLRKAKSFQPKTGEEIQKKMEARLKRNLKKREGKELSELKEKKDEPPKPQFPESLDFYNSPSLTRRKQQEKQEREDIIKMLLDGDAPDASPAKDSPLRGSPRRDETLPGSPCWSDECNMPLFKILAKRAAQRRSMAGASAAETPTTSMAALRLQSPEEATNAVSSVSVVSGGDQMSTASSSSRGRSRVKRKADEAGSSPQAQAVEADAVSPASERAEPRQQQQHQQQLVARRRVLYTQSSMLAVTPAATPEAETRMNIQKKPPPRASRKKTRLIKNNSVIVAEPPKAPVLSKTQADKSEVVRVTMKRDALPRRSSIDFIAAKPKPRFRKPPDAASGLIACTSCHSEQFDSVKQIAASLGGFRVAKSFLDKTTHVVCGDESRRTLNLLRGILSGCWIVSLRWVMDSLEAGRWLDEEPYELTTFSGAVRAQRIEREAFGWRSRFRSELFSDCGALYFARGCRAPSAELRQLAELGGGRVARLARVADVVVGKRVEGGAAKCVDERWLLDSIQKHCVMPFQDYLLSEP